MKTSTTQSRHFFQKKGTLIGGILAGLAYPLWLTVPTGFLMWFALVPLFLELKKVDNFKAYFLKTYGFILVSGAIFSHFVAYSGLKNWLTAYLLQPVLMFLPFLIHYFIQKKLGWRKALWILPFVWTFCDWLQHLVPHSFQISSIAYTQTSVIWFAQFADIFGMWGITFWLVLVNVSIALTIDHVRGTSKVPRTVRSHNPNESGGRDVAVQRLIASNEDGQDEQGDVAVQRLYVKKWAFQGILLFGLPLLYASWVKINIDDSKTVKVAIVQTNEDSYAKVDSILFGKRIQTVIRLANEAAKTEPDLIILPESALPLPILSSNFDFKMLRYYVSNWKTALAVGFPEYPDTNNFNRNYNSALVLTPQLAETWDSLGISTTELKVYRKQNPLPFVEYMPYGFNNGIGINGIEILRGYEPFVFSFPNKQGDEIKTSATICWEQMFPETQAELVKNGAMFLSQMNNDGWFGNSTGAAFLLNINRLRAIENRRSIARASNTGISAFIDPFGNIQKILKPNTEAFDTATPGRGEAEGIKGVVLNTDLTFFTQYKNWFPKCCACVMVFVFICGYRKR